MVRGEYNVCGRAAAVRGRDIPQRAARRRRRRAGCALRPGSWRCRRAERVPEAGTCFTSETKLALQVRDAGACLVAGCRLG